MTWEALVIKGFQILFRDLYLLDQEKHIFPTKADMIMTSLETCGFIEK